MRAPKDAVLGLLTLRITLESGRGTASVPTDVPARLEAAAPAPR